MFGCQLNLVEKILVVINLVLVVGILVIFWLGFGQDLIQNCWDKYQTEFEAISHCEQ